MPDTPEPPILLLTRPLAGSRRFAAQAAGLGLRCVISPLMRIEPVAHDSARLAAAKGLVFTSEHAIAAAGPGRGRPALCVGDRTAAVARAAGYDVTEGPGDAVGLAPLARGLVGEGWLHPGGRHLAAELGVPAMVVYDQLPAPPDDAARAALTGTAPVLLPLFSPRSARIAGDAVAALAAGGTPLAPLLLAAISPAAARAWTGPVPRALRVAGRPSAGS